MALSIIKEEYKNKRIGFGKSADPLSQRTDIDDLAIIARQSNDPSIVKLFKFLPELADLKRARTESQLRRPVVADLNNRPVIQEKPNRNQPTTKTENE